MIVVVGVSHRTAPIAVREQLSISADDAPDVLRALVATSAVGEAMLISTCNRLEIVAAAPAGPGASDLTAVLAAVRDLLAGRAPDAAPALYAKAGAEAVGHLFRVTASLDSLVLGEPQILGQVKEAFELARRAGTLGPALHRAVPRALRAAKRVRSETAIGSGQVSVPSVAVDLARQIFGELRGKTALLVGSGEMAESVARLLRGDGCRLCVAGRNEARTAEIARAVSGEARRFGELEAALVEADVVVSSTSATGFVIEAAMVARARRARRGKTSFFIDLAVPRDVDPSVERLDGVFLYNVDDFERVVGASLSERHREAEHAEQIVAEAVRGWERWAEAEQATPTIVALRTRLRAVLSGELEKSLKTRLRHLGADDRLALEKMLDAALKKLLHRPTVRLRDAAGEGAPGAPDPEKLERLAAALSELFALDQSLAELDDEAELAAAAGDIQGPAEVEVESADAAEVDEAPRVAGSR